MSGVRYFKLSVVISLVLSMLIVLSPLGAPQAIANIGPISITSFTIENPVFKTNEKFTLKAELNRKPGPSESLSTFFIEEETGEVVRQCSSSETCEASLSFRDGGPRNYYAIVANPGENPFPDYISEISTIVTYSSNMVTAQRAPWEVSLRADKEEFSAGQGFTLTAEFNQPIYVLSTSYMLYFVEENSGERVGHCTGSTNPNPAGNYECSMTTSFKNGNPRDYIAIIALSPSTIYFPDTKQDIILDHDPQAISNIVKVSRAPWTVEQVEGLPAFTSNQSLRETGSSYAMYITDDLSGRILDHCSGGNSCAVPIRYSEYYDKPLTAYIAAYDLNADTVADLTEIQADSKGYSLKGIDRGLPSREENTGGFNPSQLCGHTCVADPVNAITGEYYENHSDLHIKGAGASEIDFTRSYGVFQRDRDGALGYGWTHSYEMSLTPGNSNDSLSETREIKLLQENGSVITFYRDNTGELITQARNIAELTEEEGGGYRFNRKKELKDYVFNEAGQLVAIEDTNGNSLAMAYDLQDRLATITSNNGSSVSMGYDSSGRIVSLLDHANRIVEYEYSNSGDLTKVTNAKGQVYGYTYDNDHAILTFTNPIGGTTTNSYSYDYTIRRQTEPDGSQWAFSFSSTYNTVTDPMGNRTRYYHNNGRLVRQVDAYGTEDEATTSYTYDATNAISSVTDPMGYTTTFSNNADGSPLLKISPEGRTTTYTYNENGQVLTQEQGEYVYEWEYDDKGNLTKKVTPSGYITKYSYNPDGTLASMVEPRGNEPGVNPADYETKYEYDSKGHLVAVISPSGSRQSFEKDELDRASVIYDPRWDGDISKAHFIEYSNLDEVTQIRTSEDKVLESYSYDALGNILSQTDAKGNTERIEYDDLGRTISTENRRGFTTSFDLDRNGQVASINLPNNGEIINEYDRRGNVVKQTDAEGNVTEYSYDLNNRLVKGVLPGETAQHYEYSPDGLLLKKTAGDGGVVTHSYDELGQLSVLTDEVGRTVSYEYTPEGLVRSIEFLGGSKVTNEYDASGNLVSRINEEGQAEHWEYDNDGNKKKYVNIGGQATEYDYDPAGNLVSTTKPDGTVVEVEWDEDSLITEISYGNNEEVLTYEYDENGMVIQESNGNSSINFAYDEDRNLIEESYGQDRVSYSYDEMGNLTSLTYPSGTVVNYSLDLNGGIQSVSSSQMAAPLTITRTGWGDISNILYPSGVSMKQDFDDAQRNAGMRLKGHDGELLWEEAYERGSDGVVTARTGTLTSDSFNYNDRGWLTSSSGNTLGYTSSGKINKLENGLHLSLNSLGAPTFTHDGENEQVSYSYNSLGQRVHKIDVNTGEAYSYSWNKLEQLTEVSGHNSEIEYEYRPDGLLSEKKESERSSKLVWASAFEVPLLLSDGEYDYVYGDSLSPLAQVSRVDQSIEYLHTDQLGSTIAKTDESGSLVASTSFTAYGEGAPVSSFGFAGGWTDPDTELIYFRARWYDPELGVFISVDPLLEITQDAYGYSGNSPFAYIDPHGLFLNRIGDGLSALGRGVSSVGKELVEGAVTIKNTAVDWFENAPLEQKLSDLSAVAGAVALTALLANPVGAAVGIAGMTAAALSAGASALYFKKGDKLNGLLSAVSAFPAPTSAFLSARSVRAVSQASTKGKWVRSTGSESRSMRSKIGAVDSLNVTPFPFYALLGNCIAEITESVTR